MDEIIEIVSRVTNVSVDNIKAKGRKRTYSDARKIFFLIARENTNYGFEEIGNFVGRPDHSVVAYGIDTISESPNKIIQKMISDCRKQVEVLNTSFPDNYEKPTVNQLQQMFCDKWSQRGDLSVCNTSCDNCIFHESNSKEFRVWLKSNY